MPLAWVMGVEWSQCELVGELIGLKTIVNEFVAYSKLAYMKKTGLITVCASSPCLESWIVVVQHNFPVCMTTPTDIFITKDKIKIRYEMIIMKYI